MLVSRRGGFFNESAADQAKHSFLDYFPHRPERGELLFRAADDGRRIGNIKMKVLAELNGSGQLFFCFVAQGDQVIERLPVELAVGLGYMMANIDGIFCHYPDRQRVNVGFPYARAFDMGPLLRVKP